MNNQIMIYKSKKKAAIITFVGLLIALAGWLFLHYAHNELAGWCFLILCFFLCCLRLGHVARPESSNRTYREWHHRNDRQPDRN